MTFAAERTTKAVKAIQNSVATPERTVKSILLRICYWIIKLVAMATIPSLMLFYCLCRGYLLFEGFISLRQLPLEAFATPEWPQYLPHF